MNWSFNIQSNIQPYNLLCSNTVALPWILLLQYYNFCQKGVILLYVYYWVVVKCILRVSISQYLVSVCHNRVSQIFIVIHLCFWLQKTVYVDGLEGQKDFVTLTALHSVTYHWTPHGFRTQVWAVIGWGTPEHFNWSTTSIWPLLLKRQATLRVCVPFPHSAEHFFNPHSVRCCIKLLF